MHLPLALFAQIDPTWTDKEVMVAVGSAVGATVAALAPVIAAVITFMTRSHRKRAKKAEAEALDLRQDVENASEKCTQYAVQLAESKTRIDHLAVKTANHEAEEIALKTELLQSQNGMAKTQAAVNDLQHDAALMQRRLQRAFQKDGQTWNEKVLATAPDFKALEPEGRNTPIVSVLNLKGGVGKTTITANLAAALDAKGYRVLLLDLDLQGSLTSLYLNESRQQALFNGGQLLADFLFSAFDSEHPNLRDYEQTILGDSKSAIVPTTDGLAYAETSLTMRWFMRDGSKKDPRFLLRKELHLKRITETYDIVLMDCPPVMNICCVNALAASDYLLVPIQPSSQATARVPVLLRRLKELQENVNPVLRVLGIVANRTHRAELSVDESNRLTLLADQCKDIIGYKVPQFDTFIRQSTEVRSAEDEHRPLRPEDEMFKYFVQLADEVEKSLPNFCQHRPAARLQEAIA